VNGILAVADYNPNAIAGRAGGLSMVRYQLPIMGAQDVVISFSKTSMGRPFLNGFEVLLTPISLDSL